MKIPWDRTNQAIPLSLVLLDSDGQQVSVPTDRGDKPIRTGANLEVGRPPGIAPGTPIDASFVVNMSPLPLSPGRYEWRLTIQPDDEFHASFTVRDA
jgi:hypothetical protein